MDSVAEVSTRIIPCEERKRTSWKLGGGEDVSKSRDNKRSNEGVRGQEKRNQGIPREFKRIQRDISSGVAALKQILPFGVTQYANEDKWLAVTRSQFLILKMASVGPSYATGYQQPKGQPKRQNKRIMESEEGSYHVFPP